MKKVLLTSIVFMLAMNAKAGSPLRIVCEAVQNQLCTAQLKPTNSELQIVLDSSTGAGQFQLNQTLMACYDIRWVKESGAAKLLPQSFDKPLSVELIANKIIQSDYRRIEKTFPSLNKYLLTVDLLRGSGLLKGAKGTISLRCRRQ